MNRQFINPAFQKNPQPYPIEVGIDSPCSLIQVLHGLT